jgi:hypothetical protein
VRVRGFPEVQVSPGWVGAAPQQRQLRHGCCLSPPVPAPSASGRGHARGSPGGERWAGLSHTSCTAPPGGRFWPAAESGTATEQYRQGSTVSCGTGRKVQVQGSTGAHAAGRTAAPWTGPHHTALAGSRRVVGAWCTAAVEGPWPGAAAGVPAAVLVLRVVAALCCWCWRHCLAVPCAVGVFESGGAQQQTGCTACLRCKSSGQLGCLPACSACSVPACASTLTGLAVCVLLSSFSLLHPTVPPRPVPFPPPGVPLECG